VLGLGAKRGAQLVIGQVDQGAGRHLDRQPTRPKCRELHTCRAQRSGSIVVIPAEVPESSVPPAVWLGDLVASSGRSRAPAAQRSKVRRTGDSGV
jgi:hypothetical protein